MNEKNILKFLKKEAEGERLECKSSLADLKRIVEVLCSFTNKSGGIVLVGVRGQRDIPLRERIIGISVGTDTLAKTSSTIVDNTELNIYADVEIVRVYGKNVLAISVKESDDKTHTAFGRPFIRVGDTTRLVKLSHPAPTFKNVGMHAFGVAGCD